MDTTLATLRTALTDRYTVERELGRGGMATVFLARDLKHDRPVAIKVLDRELAAMLGPERFLREIRIAAGLTHPHILPVHDSGEAAGLLYYVMPFVEGESLRARLEREPTLPLDLALQIAREVAGALAEAHARGIIHRDIKPGNILLAGDHAVVADFGLARAVTAAGSDQVTQTGLVLGTPAYMSPEQAAGNPDLDGRCDLYALGCVLHEMLAGAPPFTAARPESLLHQHLMATPPALGSLRPGVPAYVEDLVLRLLAKNPGDRFPSATSVVEALKELPARDPGTRTVRRRSSRRWLIPALLGLAAVLLASAWVVTRLNRQEAAPVRRLAVVPLANLTGDSSQAYFVAGMHDALIAELASIPELVVISRQSVLRYQQSDKSLPEIARELGVDALIEGSVFRSGDSVRITVQLVRASPEEHLWASSYQRDLRSALAVHGEVARAVAGAIHATLTPTASTRLERSHRPLPVAQEAYLQGQYHIEQQGLGSFAPPERRQAIRQGIAELERAVALDPAWARAHAKLANAYHWLASQDSIAGDTLFPRAREAALRALSLDDSEAQAHGSLGFVLFRYDRDWAGADRAMRRAVELDPSEMAWISGVYLTNAGRYEEAIAQLRKAEERNPISGIIKAQLARAYYCAGRDEEAIPRLSEAMRRWPEHPFPQATRLMLLAAYIRRGLPDSARAVARRAAASDDPIALAHLGWVQAHTGAPDSARAILAWLERERLPVPLELYAALDQSARAVDLLEAAARRRSGWFIYFHCWPDRDALRSDPRFAEIEKRFPQAPRPS